MPPSPVVFTGRVAVRLLRGDESMVNVWNVDAIAEPSDADKDAILNAFLSFYENTTVEAQKGIRQHIANDMLISDATFTYIDSVPYGAPRTRIDGVLGNAAGDILPLQTALCVTLRSAVSTRSGRGRIFLGGFTETANDETSTYPRPSATLLTDVSAAMTSLRGALTTLGHDLVVASHTTGVHHTVTHHEVKNVWRTQKRRAANVPATSIVGA